MNHNHELEREVLAEMLIGTPGEAWRRLVPDDFTYAAHRDIFQVVALLLTQGFSSPGFEVVRVTGDSLKINVLPTVIAEIAESVTAGPSSFEARCSALRSLTLLRLLRDLRSAPNDDPRAFEAHWERYQNQCRALAWNSEDRGPFLDRALVKETRLLTGIPDLDHVSGGIGPQEMVVLGARPSVGKSAMALTIALNVADAGYPVCYVTIEQSEDAQRWRALAHLERWESGLPKSEPHRWEDSIRRGVETLDRLPLTITSPVPCTLAAIERVARDCQQKGGLSLLIVDYLGLVEHEANGEYERVTRIATGLKAITRRLQCPLIACAQIRRSGDRKDKRAPTMSELKGSGQIEQDADQVWILHREQDDNGRPMGTDTRLIVDKNRDGQTGGMILAFHPSQYRFVNHGWEPDTSGTDWRNL